MNQEIIIMSTLIVLSGFIAIEIGFTTAIAELIAGVVAGQFIQLNGSETLEVLADLGILTLMYVAGLEIDLDQLQKNLKKSAAIGAASFLFPFISIFLLAFYLLALPFKTALLAAIALSTTSLAIVYPILRQRGSLTDERKMILSAAMITDVLSMTVLGVAFTDTPWFVLILVVALFAFAKVFPLLGARIFGYYQGNVAEFEFKIILLLLLAMAVVAEQGGFEAAIIAFVMGMITSEIVVQHENLEVKLRGIVFGFFAPIFFFWVGLSISLDAVFRSIGLLLLFLIICFSSKYVGAYLSTRMFLPSEAKYVASLFNSRLSLGIIAAVLGYEADPRILSLELYSAIIGAVVLSSLISAFLCRTKMASC